MDEIRGDQSGPVRVKETIPPLQLSYPVPVNRLTPDNKMKALTARRLSLAMPGRDGGTKPEFVSHPELSDN